MSNIVHMPRQTVTATELKGWALLRRRISDFWTYRIRRRLPYLVWFNQPIYVRVKLTAFGLGGDLSSLWRLEDELRKQGIHFDAGTGNSRDWEWDWSLKGPIQVTFRGKP